MWTAKAATPVPNERSKCCAPLVSFGNVPAQQLAASAVVVASHNNRLDPRATRHRQHNMNISLRSVALFLASSIAIVSSRASAQSNLPGWMVPSPGTAGFLGTSGGNGVTVCDTAEHFRGWLNDLRTSGCKKFTGGESAIIKGLVFDPAQDNIPGSKIGEPLARVYIPSKKFTGYLLLMGEITPAIPAGTIIHLKRTGTLRLAPSQNADLGVGIQLGKQATVRVIRYAPSDARDLYVIVVGGPNNGKHGWIFSLSTEEINSIPITEFQYSVLNPNQSLPPNLLYHGVAGISPPRAARNPHVRPFGVRRGRQDFQHFVDYYAHGNYAAAEAVHCGFKSTTWGERVRVETGNLLRWRFLYDFPQGTSDDTGFWKAVFEQIDSAIKAGLHARLSACTTLTNSPAYFLADSLALFAPNAGR